MLYSSLDHSRSKSKKDDPSSGQNWVLPPIDSVVTMSKFLGVSLSLLDFPIFSVFSGNFSFNAWRGLVS